MKTMANKISRGGGECGRRNRNEGNQAINEITFRTTDSSRIQSMRANGNGARAVELPRLNPPQCNGITQIKSSAHL